MSRIQVRRGTSTQWTTSNPVLAQGEPGYETNTGKFKIGNGSTAWNSLAYTGTVTSVAGRLGDVTLTKSDVGLSNVDNTADADKNVLSAVTANSAAIADAAVKLQNIRTINGVAFDGTQNINIATGVSRSVQTITEPTTLEAASNTDYLVFINGATSVTLPSAVSNTNRYSFMNVNGTGTCIINTTSSQTIDGSATSFSLINGNEFFYLPVQLSATASTYTIPALGTSNFTAECLFAPTTAERRFGIFNSPGQGLRFDGEIAGSGGGYQTVMFSLPGLSTFGTWTGPSINSGHYAITRTGNTVRVFANGVLFGTTYTTNANLTSTTATIGSTIANVTGLALYKNAVKYTANFTPPTSITKPVNQITLQSDGANWQVV